MTNGELLRETTDALRAVTGDAHFEAVQLVSFALGCAPGALHMRLAGQAGEAEREKLRALTARRIAREPLQYLLGEWAFMGLPMTVRPGALIPRADTEILCEWALALIKARGYRNVLDLCCGSGCIGVAIAKLSSAAVVCADTDAGCLALTRENAAHSGVEVRTVQSDLFAALPERYDLICCNPPYLTAEDMASLQPEVAFEPRLALDGGADGLRFYRLLAQEAQTHLLPGGTLLMEIGASQAEAVRGLFPRVEIRSDYGGNARVAAVSMEDLSARRGRDTEGMEGTEEA